ncbi:MAG: 6,7-dimethyl-8-ribityllumazine synthase [Pseudomonadota bacterium]|jgi:6,7-dimethyl-8-ribityllumazine synthase
MSGYQQVDGQTRLVTRAAQRHSGDAAGLKVAVIAARFNELVVGPMLQGALAAWERHGGDAARLTLVRVPGAFELPLAAKRYAQTGRFDAIVALGCVIRGDTPHFDYVAGEAARGLSAAALDTGVPVIFGVLTTETLAQAEERADPARMDKGGEAVETAIEMARLLQEL